MKKNESETYAKMLTDVEKIVEEINSESIGLDDMVAKVESGYELIKKMKTRLDQTKEKIENLKTSIDS